MKVKAKDKIINYLKENNINSKNKAVKLLDIRETLDIERSTAMKAIKNNEDILSYTIRNGRSNISYIYLFDSSNNIPSDVHSEEKSKGSSNQAPLVKTSVLDEKEKVVKSDELQNLESKIKELELENQKLTKTINKMEIDLVESRKNIIFELISPDGFIEILKETKTEYAKTINEKLYKAKSKWNRIYTRNIITDTIISYNRILKENRQN